MRIGVVDLDTSHPQNWIPLERELGHEVVGLWDGGAVHPPGYAARFAAEHGVPRVFGRLEDMVAEVDCAIVHGCDWDTHLSKARPFVAARKAVLLDKPMVGKARDLDELRGWAARGVRVSGGSSLRFCVESREWLARPVEERGTPHTVVCGCGVDEFNYGIHAYAMMAGITGGGAHSVRHLGQGVQRRVQVRWADGRLGILVIGATPQWLPFWATVATERGVTSYQADSARLYRALLEQTLPYLAGQVAAPPLPIDELLEPERWALAARRSWTEGDREVLLSELVDDDTGYDGAAFASEYRQKRYPSGW
jgi:hypothetical protein